MVVNLEVRDLTVYTCTTRNLKYFSCSLTIDTLHSLSRLPEDGVGRSTRASFAILNKGCLLRVGLFIILCVVGVPW
jgi:hypothetical protein